MEGLGGGHVGEVADPCDRQRDQALGEQPRAQDRRWSTREPAAEQREVADVQRRWQRCQIAGARQNRSGAAARAEDQGQVRAAFGSARHDLTMGERTKGNARRDRAPGDRDDVVVAGLLPPDLEHEHRPGIRVGEVHVGGPRVAIGEDARAQRDQTQLLERGLLRLAQAQHVARWQRRVGVTGGATAGHDLHEHAGELALVVVCATGGVGLELALQIVEGRGMFARAASASGPSPIRSVRVIAAPCPR